MNIAIILAGGTGSRIASDIPKQFIELSGQMMIIHSIRPFADSDMVVLVGKKGEAYTSHTLGELLPYCVAKKDILE